MAGSVKATKLSDVVLAHELKTGRSSVWTRLVAVKAAHLGAATEHLEPTPKKRYGVFLARSRARFAGSSGASSAQAPHQLPVRAATVEWRHHGKCTNIASVNVDEEYNAIKRGLVAAATDEARHPTLLCAVVLRPLTATRTNLVLVQRDGVAVFHYSGHGHLQRGLVFMGAQYNSDPVSAAEIHALLGGFVQVVALLLTCHSEAIGEALVAVCVMHVVAVAQEVTICAGAVLLFHEDFYTLFASGHSIAKSVEQGRVAIRTSSSPRFERARTRFCCCPVAATTTPSFSRLRFPRRPSSATRSHRFTPATFRANCGRTRSATSTSSSYAQDAATRCWNVMQQLVAGDALSFLKSKALLVLDGLDAVAETLSFLEGPRRHRARHQASQPRQAVAQDASGATS
ncbi:hypothetical protein SDRG_02222 [Saprolegnia diclina VS20]|uniref:CHAT domain-containing protein n=1 Tax=Saprolegnia diclina (strain VS20) TaxID=1156394 RepID=T0R034_SAPDV|nr:hypothetical protein SDRG_02222 [Saprolegnia diclina VS20]EQC40321.1 hypothetical protein SDRG_02222 [Saprolegnia diclina VS20]|eukprot:XP_008606020.1 hypothetical protein SDRG_02222 [Saprolegnia diclina VS20]